MTPDMPVFAVAYYDTFGYERPLYTLGHDTLFAGPAAELLRRTGVIRATHDNAAAALATGAVVMVFPGGDYDVYRPTVRKTPSTSAVALDMSPRPSRPGCQSCRRCRSARRRANST